MVVKQPFVSQTAHHEYFNEFARLTKQEQKERDAEEKKAKVQMTPFKPSSSFGDTINPYPSYEPPKVAEKPPPPPGKNLIFKPSGVTGTFPIRSVIESNTPRAPPSWIQELQTKVNRIEL